MKPVPQFASESFETPVGNMVVFADETAVVAIEFRNPPRQTHPSALTNTCVRELKEYFDGTRRTFDVPLALNGTKFQKKVWNAIHKIPFGASKTYGAIAKSIGHPKAVRAVGTATGKNPLCIIVPCHRVLPADGSIGNYASGPAKKAFLLTLEHRGA